MKKIAVLSLLFLLGINLFAQNPNTVTISGRVTDFDGNPIDNSAVVLMSSTFSPIHMTFSDEDGYYKIEDVEKGMYKSLLALRFNEYPHARRLFGIEPVAEDDMNFQFWAWNVIADRDLTINARRHRLELYGFRVFQVWGAGPYLMAYVRPMSLGRILTYENWQEKDPNEKNSSVEPEDIEFKIYAGNEPLTIRSIQPLIEFAGENEFGITAFLLQFDLPTEPAATDRYIIFRLEATHHAFGGERGENIYFWEFNRHK
ncbi:MAG: carboxypeptidase regulatory-like domain-containing protein [Bacteroidales bacterium]|nr:carboxypeptidase regulatory-like domain-containing protein [Bacteroidales bacterium]